ncbi:MAG: hypothetical protein IJG33_11650 [Selenomonadaceae bacterium]|nr:hypothetical protein [Selenomonadaceae bacterium]
MFDRGMTNEQFNSHLETLAKLIEASAKSVEDAAKIVRDAKLDTSKEEHITTALNFAAENLALPEVHVEEKIMEKIEGHKDF